jgi:hypothetical protein
MADHAWCHDIARDAAVRAAEDNRTGPLPTLGEAIALFSPSEEGLRTERVTLEIVRGDGLHVRQWPWRDILMAWGLGEEDEAESVRVVEEAYFDDLAQVSMQRDAAIRERDKLKARVAELEGCSWVPKAERDALQARVAALEIKLEAASGGGEGEAVAWARRFHECYERLAPQFGYETRKDTRVFDPESQNGKLMCAVMESIVCGKAPPQPRGWLSGDERLALDAARTIIDGSGQTNIGATIDNLLARSSPPEVDLPISLSPIDEELVRASLAAAGVAVKEVPRE